MFQEKLDFMIEEGRRLRNAITALGITYDDLRPLRSGIKYKVSTEGEVTWTEDPKSLKKKDEAGYTFHEAYEYLNGSPSCRDSGVLLEKSDFDGKAHPPDPAYLFKPDFQFSDDPEVFGGEFRHVRWLFAYTKGKDEQVDFLAMKALSHAGKMTGLLESEGQRRDKAAMSGGKGKKNRYSDDDIVDAYYKCEATNVHAMYVEIDDYLTQLKKRTNDKKAVPSRNTIIRALEKRGLDKKLKK